jgi:colanic acid biosynthesis glycosyl transferase WcaI
MTTMPKPGKILVASQYYARDSSTTAVYMAAIAQGLAIDNQVIVLSGSPNSRSKASADQERLTVVEIQNWTPPKDALVRRTMAISLLAL